MTLTADARHDCGRVVSYNDFIAGVCPCCGLLLEESPATVDPFTELVCENGHRLFTGIPENWVGRPCNTNQSLFDPAAVERGYVTEADVTRRPLCNKRWQIKEPG